MLIKGKLDPVRLWLSAQVFRVRAGAALVPSTQLGLSHSLSYGPSFKTHREMSGLKSGRNDGCQLRFGTRDKNAVFLDVRRYREEPSHSEAELGPFNALGLEPRANA